MTRPTEGQSDRGAPDRRTWLVTPGATPERFEASRCSGADVALLDLEDSVPSSDKDTARVAVLDFLQRSGGSSGRGATVVGIRINAPGTVPGLKDLLALAEIGVRPAVLVVPKVEASRDVELVSEILNTNCAGAGRIWALIETPRAIADLPGILRSPDLAGVLFGAADYAAAAGCKLTRAALLYPRQVLAAGAAAAGLPAVDSPNFDLGDQGKLRRETADAVELGFAGKVAIHPRQLSVIQSAFRPEPRELANARAVVRAADAADGAITTVNDRMVGPPLVAAARALTARAGDLPVPASSKESHCV